MSASRIGTSRSTQRKPGALPKAAVTQVNPGVPLLRLSSENDQKLRCLFPAQTYFPPISRNRILEASWGEVKRLGQLNTFGLCLQLPKHNNWARTILPLHGLPEALFLLLIKETRHSWAMLQYKGIWETAELTSQLQWNILTFDKTFFYFLRLAEKSLQYQFAVVD